MNRSDSNQQIRSRGTWRSLDGTNGLPGPVLTFHQDPGGHLWMGSCGRGVEVYDGNTIHTLGLEDGLAGDRVWALAEDGGGRRWIGTNTGLSCRDGTVFVDIDMEPDLRHIDVNDLLVAGDGRLWVAHDNRVGGL